MASAEMGPKPEDGRLNEEEAMVGADAEKTYRDAAILGEGSQSTKDILNELARREGEQAVVSLRVEKLREKRLMETYEGLDPEHIERILKNLEAQKAWAVGAKPDGFKDGEEAMAYYGIINGVEDQIRAAEHALKKEKKK